MYSVQNTPKGGFPHSEICASKVARTSSQHIAACYVLHRLLVPRHSPNALLTLETSIIRRDKPKHMTNTQPQFGNSRFIISCQYSCQNDSIIINFQKRITINHQTYSQFKRAENPEFSQFRENLRETLTFRAKSWPKYAH